jgi:hypothetical protein
MPWQEARMREFLGKAWDTISSDGIANLTPGEKGSGARANRHAEHRQIHFADAAGRDRLLEHLRRQERGRDPRRPPEHDGEGHRLHRALRAESRRDLPHAPRPGAEGSSHREPEEDRVAAGPGGEARRALRLRGRANQAIGEYDHFRGRRRHRAPQLRRQARRRSHRIVLRRQADLRGGLAPERHPDLPALEDGDRDSQPGERRRPAGAGTAGADARARALWAESLLRRPRRRRRTRRRTSARRPANSRTP